MQELSPDAGAPPGGIDNDPLDVAYRTAETAIDDVSQRDLNHAAGISVLVECQQAVLARVFAKQFDLLPVKLRIKPLVHGLPQTEPLIEIFRLDRMNSDHQLLSVIASCRTVAMETQMKYGNWATATHL